jgi:hypothetical protein
MFKIYQDMYSMILYLLITLSVSIHTHTHTNMYMSGRRIRYIPEL